MFCFCFLLTYFLNITARTIIWISTGPIFAKVAGFVELWLQIVSLKIVYRSLEGRCLGNQVLLFCSCYQQNWFAGRRRLVAQPGGPMLDSALHVVQLRLCRTRHKLQCIAWSLPISYNRYYDPINRESSFMDFIFFDLWILLNFKNAHWILF